MRVTVRNVTHGCVALLLRHGWLRQAGALKESERRRSQRLQQFFDWYAAGQDLDGAAGRVHEVLSC